MCFTCFLKVSWCFMVHLMLWKLCLLFCYICCLLFFVTLSNWLISTMRSCKCFVRTLLTSSFSTWIKTSRKPKKNSILSNSLCLRLKHHWSWICTDRSKCVSKSSENPGQGLHPNSSFLNSAQQCSKSNLLFCSLMIFIVVLYIFFTEVIINLHYFLTCAQTFILYCKWNYLHQ